MVNIKKYICNYAFLIFRHKTFFSIGRESMEELVGLCDQDSLNVPEISLFSYLYRLCVTKMGDKDFPDFGSPFELFKHKFGTRSLFDAVRLASISMEEFMSFVNKNPGAMNNDEIVEILQTIHQPTCPGTKRKHFQMVSSYPRNLSFRVSDNPQGDVAHWERDKVETYFVFGIGSKEAVALPSITYGTRQIRCTIHYLERSISMTGRVISRSTGCGCVSSDSAPNKDQSVKITVSMVNFRHDRWKKSSEIVKLCSNFEFEISNILSRNAIEGSSTTATGYVFNIEKYPEYSEDGTSLMLCVSVDGQY